MKYLKLEIPGRPAPKGSRTFGRRKDGSIYNRESSSRSSDWMKGAAEIIRQQDGFLRHGVAHLRPLILRDVADEVSLHESTVSRVTSNKAIATPRGTL